MLDNNNTAPGCDSNEIFTEHLPKDLKNPSANMEFISYSIPNVPNSLATIYCDTIARLAFPTYTLDTSIKTNMHISRTLTTSTTAITTTAHPS